MTIDTSERRSGAGRRDAPVPYRHIGSLSSTKRDASTSESAYFIKTARKDVVQFGEKEYFLWRLLDGKNAVADIQSKFNARFGAPLTPEQLDSFIDQLVECNVIEPIMPGETAPPKSISHPLAPSPLDELEEEFPLDYAGVRFTVRLFNPSNALRVLDWLCGPLRFFRWLLLPALVAMSACLALAASLVPGDVASLRLPLILGLGALALLATAIVPPLSQAVVASFLGYTTRRCGISLRWGIVPCLVFDDSAWETMASRHVFTVVAAPCVARLVLFAVGTGLWLAERSPGDWLPVLALGIGLLGLLSFLVSAAPFLPTQGRRWLATVFGRTDPWSAGGGHRLHILVLSGFWLQAATGTLLLLSSMVLQSINAAWYQPLVGLILQSVALPLLAIVPIVTRLWLRGMVKSQGTARPAYGYVGDGLEGLAPGTQARERGLGQQRDLDTVGAPARRPATEYWPSIAPIIIWAVVLAVAVAVAFVPYPYEAGGSFSILPNDKIQLNARIQGELTEVLVNEGDWVKPGQLMGVLSDWDQRYNLESARAQLENAKANLQTLFEMPRPEDIELARKQYEAALAKLPYDKAQYDRYASLVRNDTVSRSNYDQVLSIYQQDQAAADVARANYNQVRAGATPSQIEQARALVRQYTAAVAYYEDQLERTRIRATSAGRVVTQNPQLLRGQWFNPNVPNGALVFTVEDQHIVQADVYVPETDIDHVRVGGAVRARPWGYPKDIFPGKVVSIAPDAQPDPGGGSSNVIRVRTEIPNPDGRLHPTMAGYAKLTGVYLPTWESFMQMIIRFFMVEIWSWIP